MNKSELQEKRQKELYETLGYLVDLAELVGLRGTSKDLEVIRERVKPKPKYPI